MTIRQQRLLFYSAAAFNWLACVLFFPAFGLSDRLGLTPAMTNGPYDQIALVAIALFGYGYWIVAGNPAANRGIVVLGLIGKLAVVSILFGHYFFVGDVNLRLAGVTVGDLIYCALFMRVLQASEAVA
jgi:hypothetical protein